MTNEDIVRLYHWVATGESRTAGPYMKLRQDYTKGFLPAKAVDDIAASARMIRGMSEGVGLR